MLEISILYYTYAEHASPSLQKKAAALLDESETRRFQAFKAVKAAEQFLLGRLLAKTALAEHLECKANEINISLTENGKPKLSAHPELGFSIAHCENAIVVAVANTNIGVDIEKVERFKKPGMINNDFFSDSIVDNIARLSDAASKPAGVETAFQSRGKLPKQLATQYWTAIEAVVKLEDSSIFSERGNFNLLLNENGEYTSGRQISLVTWQLNEQVLGSIAVRNPNSQAICVKYKRFGEESLEPFVPESTTKEQIISCYCQKACA